MPATALHTTTMIATAAQAVRMGYPFESVEHLAKQLGTSTDTVLKYAGLSRSTIRGRALAKEPLSRTESDQIYRLQRALERASAVFGDEVAAVGWLRHPQRALGNIEPLSLVDTTPGFEQLMDELGRIEYGSLA